MKRLFLFALAVLCSTMMLAQSKVTVTGTVTAKDDGLGVPGTSVVIKGTKIGTFTDDNGKYTLANVPANAVLSISSVGFTTVEVAVNGRAVVNVELTADAQALDETIIVAYGTAKKGTYTGAAAVVKAEAIKDAPVTSFESALNGKVAGLQVTQSSGQAGSTTSIHVRGIGSMNASTEPLYVVDGVPVIQGNIGQMADYTYSTNNVMSTLNPDDIESITVLKDAAASALYGSRAANGVVVITTKRGKAGKPVVKFKASVSVSPDWAYNNYEVGSLDENIGYMYEVFYDYNISSNKTEEYAMTNALSRINTGNGPTATKFGYLISLEGTGRYPKFKVGIDPDANQYYKQREGKFFDWDKALFRNGVMQTYDISVSGGNDQTTYYSSISYTADKGRSINNSFARVSGRLNVNQKVSDHFEFMTNVNIGRTKNKGFNDTRNLGSNYFLATRNLLWETYWPYNYDDDGNRVPYTARYVSYGYNNIYYKDTWEAYSRTLKIQASETLTLHIIDGLDLRTVFSYDNSEVLDHYYISSRHYNGTSTDGEISEITTNYNKLVSSTTATYNVTLGDKHSINLLAGFESEKNKTDFARATGSFLPGSMSVVSVAGTKDANAYNWGNAMASVLSRAEYSYDNKYYASASFRRDGSSKLGKENRWGNFWSVAGSWRITNEEWVKNNAQWLSNLRLRASYGVNGTLPSNNYGWRSLSSASSRYMGLPGSFISTTSDPNLTWETNYTFNVALEFGLFDQRIYGTVEWFNRDSKDLLQDVPLPYVTGYSSTLRNLGEMNNKGFEIEFGGEIIRNSDVKWDASITASFIKSKVVKLYDGEDIAWWDPTGSDDRAKYCYSEGKSTLSFFGREWIGVNPENGKQVWALNNGTSTEGLTATPNSDGYFLYNGKAASYDYMDASETYIGNASPTVYGGFNTSVSWKGLSLGLNFIYKIGGDLYDGAEKDVDDDGYYWSRTRSHKACVKRWREPGDVTSIPQVRGTDLEDAMIKSSRHIHAADFLRLKTATLSYNLPKNIVSKAGLTGVRVYASGTNLLTWAAFDQVDPEVNHYGTRGWEIPFCKTYTFGLELTF